MYIHMYICMYVALPASATNSVTNGTYARNGFQDIKPRFQVFFCTPGFRGLLFLDSHTLLDFYLLLEISALKYEMHSEY
jgi:hypothetical protein